MYPNEQSCMPNDNMNIEKHIKTYLLNTCVFSVNPRNKVPHYFFPPRNAGGGDSNKIFLYVSAV
jgi:hypothetical protein